MNHQFTFTIKNGIAEENRKQFEEMFCKTPDHVMILGDEIKLIPWEEYINGLKIKHQNDKI